ncbi:ligand-binding sensor domain-containing protein [Luteimonas sp. e5]
MPESLMQAQEAMTTTRSRPAARGWAMLLGWLLAALPVATATATHMSGDSLAVHSPPVLRHYGLEHELPQLAANGVLRTQDGFLWISTFGGLARFDGHEFRTFRSDGSDSGPSSRRIVSLHEDARQRLWIGTEDAGVSVHEHGRFRHLPICGGSCMVDRVFSGDGGDIWALTSVGVIRIDPDSLRARGPGQPGQFSQVVHIGSKVLVAGVSGLRRLSDGKLETIALPEGHHMVSSMVALGDSAWMVLNGGDLYRFDADSEHWTWLRGGLTRETRVLTDGVGGLYLSDGVEGTRRLADDGSETPLEGAQRLFAATMTADADGALWIGTPGNGLWMLRPSRVSLLRSTSVPDAPGRVLARDGAGGMWVAMGCMSLWHVDAQGRQRAWPIEATVDEGCIHSLVHDADTGTLWIGMSGGSLERLVGGRVERVAAWPRSRQVAVWKMRDGSFWVANLQFVGRMRFTEDGALAGVEQVDELAGMEVKRIVDARAGGVWVVGDHGAFRVVDGDVVERWTPAQGINGRFFRALHEDADGVLWIGSYGHGLIRIENGKVQQYTEANGLFDDTVSCILPGERGRLWLAGNRGIGLLLDRNIGDDGPLMRSLTAQDGLDPSEFNGSPVPPCADDGAGQLWFAMMTGVARITPAQLSDWVGSAVPAAYIDHVAVSGNALDVSRPGELGVSATNLEIRYGAIALHNSGKVRFRYRLTGLDDVGDWIDAGTNRSLLLPVVPWGQLIFEVQARVVGGPWSPSATLQLSRPRPWYRHQWIWLAVSLASLLAVLRITREQDVPGVDDALLARLRRSGAGPVD